MTATHARQPSKGQRKLQRSKKNKNLEYQMKKGGKLNKQVQENFLRNQNSVAEFLTDMFDLMKNSQFNL